MQTKTLFIVAGLVLNLFTAKAQNFLGANSSELEKGMVTKEKLISTLPKSSVTENNAISYCDNLGFELKNFTNWQGLLGYANFSTWDPCPVPTTYDTLFLQGSINLASNTFIGALGTATTERQVILTCATCHDTLARDPLTGVYKIPYLAPGGSGVSVRLGNAATGAESAKLRYELDISPLNSFITLYYSIVLENAAAHSSDESPFFNLIINDSLGGIAGPVCDLFCYYATDVNPDYTILPAGNPYNADLNEMKFKTWDSIQVDLSPLVGREIKVEFTTGDCSLGGHFGYAYVDAKCEQGIPPIIVTIDPNDSLLILVAPNGSSNFQWLDSVYHPFIGANSDSFFIMNPINGESWNLSFKTANNCVRYIKYIFQSQVSVPTIHKSAETIQIYPNPAEDEITLSYLLNSPTKVEIDIKSTLGELMYRNELATQNRGKQIQKLDIQQLKAGIYFITISFNGNKITRKISVE